MKTKFKVQKLVTLEPRTKRGQVWVTVGPVQGFGRIVTAEQTMNRVRIDEPDTQVRLVKNAIRPAPNMAVW